MLCLSKLVLDLFNDRLHKNGGLLGLNLQRATRNSEMQLITCNKLIVLCAKL